MRRYIIFFTLCVILFILPLQVFIIGDFVGIGIQGAVYRYQTSGYGTYFFPITREIVFVLNGTLTGRTALSVLLWASGTVLMTCTTVYAFFHVDDTVEKYYRQITAGLVASCIIYLGSCVAQYGFFFKGMSGFSLPVGIVAIPIWIGILYFFQHACIKGQITE